VNERDGLFLKTGTKVFLQDVGMSCPLCLGVI